MTMPFGKYYGVPIEDLPDDYLDWLQSINLRSRLKSAVWDEIESRARGAHHHGAGVAIEIRPEELPLAREVFDQGYRAVARRLHPDAGGSVEQMQVLNGLAESVRGQFAAVGA